MKKVIAILVVGAMLITAASVDGQETSSKTTGRVTTYLAADGTNLTVLVEKAIATTSRLYAQETPITQEDLRVFIRDVNEALSASLLINTATDIRKTSVQTKELSVRPVEIIR